MYRYETHLHTSVSSACSRFTPEEIIEKYTRLGYAGVFVTDHYLRGNSSVPKDLPYDERVKLYFDGYRAVKKCAKGSGLDVFCGVEISHFGTDFLFFGLDEEWYVNNPAIMTETPREFCHRALDAGALVLQAHPYRERHYIDHLRLFPSDVEGIEIVNATEGERSNNLAKILAEAYNLKISAGSDIHRASQEELAGMEFQEKLKSEQDFIDKIRRGEGSVFTLTDKGAV